MSKVNALKIFISGLFMNDINRLEAIDVIEEKLVRKDFENLREQLDNGLGSEAWYNTLNEESREYIKNCVLNLREIWKIVAWNVDYPEFRLNIPKICIAGLKRFYGTYPYIEDEVCGICRRAVKNKECMKFGCEERLDGFKDESESMEEYLKRLADIRRDKP